MNIEVPFRSNSEDDNHCAQASLGMILEHFEPGGDYSWQKLDEITGAVPQYWTWPGAMLLWLVQNGYEVEVYDVFDNEQFAQKGAQYIYETQGSEVGEAQERYSDIPREQAIARQLIGKIAKHDVVPTQDHIKRLLDDGYIPLCRVNSAALNGQDGYYGHSIIVTGYDDDGLIIHDPGLPALEARHVSSSVFESAWAYPVPESKNISAIKPADSSSNQV
jgi:hypothetical protein